MNSSIEQSAVPRWRPHSGGTRQRLLSAAAELIAEVGWGRVTTRAVAQRAGLPLGTVSYHFRGKQELLTQAALGTVEDLFPMAELAAVGTLAELIGRIKILFGDRLSIDPVVSAVLMETMREAGRDLSLRECMASLLAEYRRLLTELARREGRRSTAAGVDPAALATLIAAAGDGLLLHALLDREVDIVSAFEALLALLHDEAEPASRGPREKS